MEILNLISEEYGFKKDKYILFCVSFLMVLTYGIFKPYSLALLSSLKSINLFSSIGLLSLASHFPILSLRNKLVNKLGPYKSLILIILIYGLLSSLLLGFSHYFFDKEVSALKYNFIICFAVITELFNIVVLGIFWSFIHYFIKIEVAHNIYPKLILCGQFGALFASFLYSIFVNTQNFFIPCLIILLSYSIVIILLLIISKDFKVEVSDILVGRQINFINSLFILFKDNYYRSLLFFGISTEILTLMYEFLFISTAMFYKKANYLSIFFLYKFLYSLFAFAIGVLNAGKNRIFQIKVIKLISIACLFICSISHSLNFLLLCSSIIKALMHTVAYNIKLLYWIEVPTEDKFHVKPWHEFYCKLISKVIGFIIAFLFFENFSNSQFYIYLSIILFFTLFILIISSFLTVLKKNCNALSS